MILRSSNKKDTNRYELEIEISPEDFNKEVDKIYKREIRNISVPGFRKGKAPRAFVEKYYGEKVFYEDAVNSIYPYAIDDAAKEANIEVIDDHIDFDIVKIGKNDGLVFKAVVTVMPEVEIDNYKGIEVSRHNPEVGDNDVEEELKVVQEKNGRLVTVTDRSAKMGDSVVIDFEGFTDGKAFDGGKGENFTLELGKKQFIEGFEEQIVGHNTNDEFDVNVTFPEKYHSKDLAGKPAVFKVKLHEIKELELPEINDDFIKDISEFNTVDEYKEDLKKKILERKQNKAKQETDKEMTDKLTELVKCEIPDALIKMKIRDLMGDFEYRLQAQGMRLSDYIKYTGTSMEDFQETFRPQAERQVKIQLALKKISELESLNTTEEELEEEYNKIAEHYHMELDKVKSIVPKADVEKDIMAQKSLELVRDNIVVKD